MKKKFYCPVNDWSCFYWKNDGTCKMVDEGDKNVMTRRLFEMKITIIGQGNKISCFLRPIKNFFQY